MSQFIKPQIVWTKEKIELLRKEYPRGNNKKLAKKFGISYSALKCSAQRFGVKGGLQNHYRLKPLIEETLENYYWMGFIMADGFISDGGELKVSLSQKDKSHLQKLALKLNVKVINKEIKASYKHCKVSILTCKDASYGVQLKRKMNIVGKKTYNPPKLDFIKTEEQFLSFFVGFVDGDGHIEYRNNRPCCLKINCHGSWIVNLIWMQQWLLKLNLKSSTIIDSRGYSLLRMSTSGHILRIKDWAYSNNIPLMERKWLK